MFWHRIITFWKAVRRRLGWVLDLAYPRDCLFCKRDPGEEGHLCETCLRHLVLGRGPSCQICGAESMMNESADFVCSDCLQHRPAFERAFIAARYECDFRSLVHAFKYHDGVWLTGDMVRFLYAVYLLQLQPAGIAPEVVVPVPMQFRKLRRRGYNQASFLARGLAKQLGLPCREGILRRVPTGVVSQTRLTRRQRLENALRAYQSCPSADVAGKVVLLVDDVMTTGATLDACARRLREAGATKVYTLALARGVTL